MTTPACSGNCSPGWFCPAGSITRTALPCGGGDRSGLAAPRPAPRDSSHPLEYNRVASDAGSLVFCPAAVGAPLLVQRGFYAVQTVKAGEEERNEEERQDSQRNPTSSLLVEAGFDAQKPCPVGSFCDRGRRYPCPPGASSVLLLLWLLEPALQALYPFVVA